MEDRPLDFNRSDDPTRVELNQPQVKKLNKNLNDLSLVLSQLTSGLKEKTLTEGYKETLLSLLEAYSTDICKTLGYEGILEKQKQERHARMRSLNEENRELRRQLGDKVTNDDVKEKLKNISSALRTWAKSLGFYIRDVDYSEYGNAKVKLDPGISSIIYDEDVSFPQIKAAREARGYTFVMNSGRDADCLFTEKNLELLKSEIREKFPTCGFGNIECRSVGKQENGKEYMELSQIEFRIYSLDQI